MIRNSQGLTLTAASLILLASSCQKDELTVVSTATTHTCTKTSVVLNVDSLLNGAGGPWGPELHYTMCECDTIAFYPINIPFGCDFDHWVIDQGQENAYQNELVLDTITVGSELWMDLDNCGPDHHIRIQVSTEHCE